MNKQDRRTFVRNTAVAATGFFIVPRHVLGRGYVAPSDKLLIAGIGAGGKGGDDINEHSKSPNAEIAFLCDVDDRQAEGSRKKFPKAKYYKDWRKLFEKESKNFDAVSVGTPDHNHAIIGFHAMQLGKHVYVQKPLSHDIYESRMLTEAADRYKVITQMGDQGASHDGQRLMKEWYDAGIIGEAESVYCWTDRPVWPQGIPWPKKAAPIPAGLDWDLWLGYGSKSQLHREHGAFQLARVVGFWHRCIRRYGLPYHRPCFQGFGSWLSNKCSCECEHNLLWRFYRSVLS